MLAIHPPIFELAPESWYKVKKIDTVVFYLENDGTNGL
jgi:hypothetical protein